MKQSFFYFSSARVPRAAGRSMGRLISMADSPRCVRVCTRREQARADSVQASTGTSAAEAAAEASESAAEAANLVEMETVTEAAAAAAAVEPEPQPAVALDDEPAAGQTNG